MSDNGHFRKYRDINFKDDTLKIIAKANKIIEEYEGKGFSMTVRQLYYQFVARDWLENNQANYDRLGRIISDGRLAGLVSWTALEDRGRNLMGYTTFDSPGEAMQRATHGYKIDRWANQPFRPEVWVEKQAMEGVIGSVCNKLRVDFFATKGYNSQSEQWRAGQRFAGYIRKGQRPIVFHLADHDPSGIDMTADIASRLEMFAGTPILVQRLALNMDQINKYGPPPNFAKETDSRLAAYERQFGTRHCWEMDALEPTVIHGLIQDAVIRIRDSVAWEEMAEQETDDIRVMEDMIAQLGGRPDEDD